MSQIHVNKLNTSNYTEKLFSLSTTNLPIKPYKLLSNKSKANAINPNSKKNNKKITQFILGKKLGNGAFATVRLATHIKTNKIVAIKIFDKQKLKEKDKIRLEREINILKKVKHRNIVNMYKAINCKNSIYLIMEYIKGIELFSYVNQKKRLSEIEACQYYQQIISGIEYLEKLKIVHRDIKLENIIIENKNNIKIIDFGLSNIYPQNNILFSSCGSPCYAPPEMILGKNYTGSGIDIWSSGIVLFAMLCGYLPFIDTDEQKLYKKIVEGKLNFPHNLSNSAKDLLKKLLNKDPLKRINISKIKKHQWFKLGEIKLNMTPGLILDEIVTPIDLDIVNLMSSKYGYEENEIKIDLLKNKHNDTTTTYYILLDAKIKNGGISIGDLKSKEFLNYINNPNNLLSNYNYDINKVIEKKIYKNINDNYCSLKKIKSYNNSPKNLKIFNRESRDKLQTKKGINNTNDIGIREEYLINHTFNETNDIMNKPININLRNNSLNNKIVKKRNKSRLVKNKDINNNFITNTTYFHKPKLKIFESKGKNEEKEKIEKNINIYITKDNTDFIKETINKDNVFLKLNHLEKKKHLTINNKTNNNNSFSNSKYIKFNKKEKERNTIKLNSINKNSKIIIKKIVNRKIEKSNHRNKTFINKLYLETKKDKYNNTEIINKNSLSNIRKNPIYKKKEKHNTNKNNITLNIRELNNKNNRDNSFKNLFSFENNNTCNNLTEKKNNSKKLYVKLKKPNENENYLILDKNKLIKKTNSKPKNNININITSINTNSHYNEEKKNYDYKKMKTIDLKIKELGRRNKNKVNKERAESVKERNAIIEKIDSNKRLNTETKNISIEKPNSKKVYKRIKINKVKNYINYTINGISNKDKILSQEKVSFSKKEFVPFCISNIIILNNIYDVYEFLNNKFMKNNKIRYTKQKNKYICYIKENKVEIIFEKIDDNDNLYHLKIIRKSLNKTIKDLINNIINSISKL